MQKDLRQTPLYREAESIYRAVRQPGTGRISDAGEVSTNGTHVAFAGTLVEVLDGTAPTRICLADLASGDTRVLTFGPNTDRLPKFSPDGRQIAFLSDRHQAGDFQLYLLDPADGAARPAPSVDGWVEYFHWSPDGKRILLGVAGRGADVAGAQGAVTSKNSTAATMPSWMPAIETGDESYRWRRAWVYELATARVELASPAESNIWEAVWCGNDAFAAVVSPGPNEGLWYTARLQITEIGAGSSREIFAPQDQNQLGWPAASPSGKHLVVVEAVCSDRWCVAGDLRLIDTSSGKIQRVDTRGTDITSTQWRSDRHVLLVGQRGFEAVIALYDVLSGVFTDVLSSQAVYPGHEMNLGSVAGLNESGDCVLIGESCLRAPEIAVVQKGTYRAVKSFDVGYADLAKVIAAVERVSWNAPDGLEIQGWLLRPQGEGPYPLVMSVHGGPVGQARPSWGRGNAVTLMLLKRGYAMFLPNPRGSTGHGQAFARRVVGDIGGADTYDLLSGLDHLVERGIADPKRLGVTGGSYGGFMTSWLITQDSRFAAAVAIAPHNNQVTEHLLSNIPDFVDLFLADKYTNPGGKYFQRSPIMHAHKAKTPTLNICGELDRCTPPEEAIQFHNALLENGVTSALVKYPGEGHGVRKWPAVMDNAARVVAWFEAYMSPNADRSSTAAAKA